MMNNVGERRPRWRWIRVRGTDQGRGQRACREVRPSVSRLINSGRGASQRCVRMCAKRVVAGSRLNPHLPIIGPVSARLIGSAQVFDQFDGLTVAIP